MNNTACYYIWRVLRTEADMQWNASRILAPYLHNSVSFLCSQRRWWPILLKYFKSIFKYSTSPTRFQFAAPPLLRESETERWWSGCGGGGLTREEGMTAAIIKNVLLRRYLEASPPLHHPLLPPPQLITHLSLRYTARRRGCWPDRAIDRRQEKKVLNISIWLRQFSATRLLHSFAPRAYCYSGTLIIKFKSLPSFSVCQRTVI